MANNVLIGVQARSTSARFPNKHQNLLNGRMIIDHVIDACMSACYYANKNYGPRMGVNVKVALLTPVDDPLASVMRNRLPVIEGPEHDVLQRYVTAQEKFSADYICRITGDCPLIPAYVISKHIVVAIKNNYDYLSNVDEEFRTVEDGLDCEIMSKKMLEWLGTYAKAPEYREHVTLMARAKKPNWAKMGLMLGDFDHSKDKYSVDTPEDLERVRAHLAAATNRRRAAKETYGDGGVHSF